MPTVLEEEFLNKHPNNFVKNFYEKKEAYNVKYQIFKIF